MEISATKCMRTTRNTKFCRAGELLFVQRQDSGIATCYRTGFNSLTGGLTRRGKPFDIPVSSFDTVVENAVESVNRAEIEALMDEEVSKEVVGL